MRLVLLFNLRPVEVSLLDFGRTFTFYTGAFYGFRDDSNGTHSYVSRTEVEKKRKLRKLAF